MASAPAWGAPRQPRVCSSTGRPCHLHLSSFHSLGCFPPPALCVSALHCLTPFHRLLSLLLMLPPHQAYPRTAWSWPLHTVVQDLLWVGGLVSYSLVPNPQVMPQGKLGYSSSTALPCPLVICTFMSGVLVETGQVSHWVFPKCSWNE